MKLKRKSTRVRPRCETLEARRLLAAQAVEVSIENLAPDGGLSLTPLWVGFQDGSFRVARAGRPASAYPGLEALAEEGDVTGLRNRFATDSNGVDAVLTAPAGFAGAPVIEPGETATATLDVMDTEVNRFFSYASMVIPSNDAFVANVNSRAISAFDSNGNFRGPITIQIFGRDILDSGTEVNDPFGGAAFSTEGGTGVDEGGRIRSHRGLDDFIGTGLPTGENLQSAFDGRTPIARITIDTATPASDGHGPTVSGGGNDLTAVSDFIDVDVVYTDPSGVDPTSIDPNDIIVVGRGGTRLNVVSVSTDAGTGTTPETVTATYRVEKVGGGNFSAEDNGAYRIFVQRREVSDTGGNFTRRIEAGQFYVNLAQQLEVTIENLADAGGLTLTPLWVGFHDGTFDVGTRGEAASNFGGLEDIAEEGDATALRARFAADSEGFDAVLTAPGGFAGAPVIEPGESASATIDVNDPLLNSYFSYASMVIPSNDAFIANLNEQQFEVFDRSGRFRRPVSIYVFGRNVYDAGTEVNNPTGGAAFSTEGGTGVDENSTITRLSDLDAFIGTGTPTGTLVEGFNARTPIAKITIAPPGDNVPMERGRPTATADISPVTTAVASTDIEVEIVDPSGIDFSQLQASDLIVVRRGGEQLTVSNVTFDTAAGITPRTLVATFTVESSSGDDFSTADNGDYRVILRRDAVTDGNGIANRNIDLGRLSIDL